MRDDILLLFPPCDSPHRPGAALPQLAGYLRGRGLPLRALDANVAFFKAFFTERKVEEGWARGADRLASLAGRPSLDFSAMMEYLGLVKASLVLERGGRDLLARALDSGSDLPGPLRSVLFESLSKFIWADVYPESLWNVGEGLFFEGGSPYSTKAILEGARSPGLFGDFFGSFVEAHMASHRPRLVALSVTYGGQVIPAFRLAREIKARFPDLFIVMGGAFVSLHLARTEKGDLFRWVDAMAVGDGEKNLESLYLRLGDGGDLASVEGLVSFREGSVLRVPPASPTPLRRICPDWSDFPEKDYYRDSGGDFTGFRLSRGCSWARCAFCRTEEAFISHRDRGGSELFARLRPLVASGRRSFAFGDDEADPDLLETFARWLLDEGIEIGWSVNARIGSGLSMERCRLLRRAGCRRLILGVESLDDGLLGLMGKGTTGALVERTLSNAAWAGLPLGVYMIVGFPTEGEETAWKSFGRIAALRSEGLVDSVFYSAFQLAPGSDVALHPERYGVEAIRYPRDADLNPPAVDFEAPGMSRQRAFSLSQEFSARLREQALSEGAGPPPSLLLAGRKIPLPFPPRLVGERIRWYAPPHLDFFSFLERGDESAPPLERS